MMNVKTLAMSMVAAAALAAPVQAQQPKPAVAEAAARATALAKVPGGRVQSGELEREGGRLIYSYDIVVAGKAGVQEVHVDANTGKVLTVEHENAGAEAREAREESELRESGEKAEAGETAETGEQRESTEADPAALSRQARLTKAQAQALAMKKVPGGSLKASELENEKGRLIYSFEFTVPGQDGIVEVNVDARTGEVLPIEHEGG